MEVIKLCPKLIGFGLKWKLTASNAVDLLYEVFIQ